ncbi:MAG TPA: MFS transporter [Steroidobacteraceae bacterium]|nr:MFS transporter [Steroidobacteraceae bacterium]
MPDARSGTAHVIGASALGTLFEWYDFFLYGALAGHIAAHFFSGVDPTTAFILALATFAVGFIVRPLGALVFGRIGDRAGRKNTFLVTLAIMGIATFLVGVLPGRDEIGIAAPLLLVLLRILQGLAIGGEFGGAIVYVAEHADAGRRGFATSWIPGMALGGLLLSLGVIMAVRASMPEAEFADRGWRVPFLLSAVLLVISLWIRIRLQESPVFRRMKEEQALSRAPVSEAFLHGPNARLMLAALFGAVVGQAVTFYTGTFYAFYFLERIARVDAATVTAMTAVAIALGAPLVLACGWLSDRVGRKPPLLAGLALAVLLYVPLFESLLAAANPALARARAEAPVILHAVESECSLQFDLLGRRSFDGSSCDIAKSFLARAGIGHTTHALASPSPARVEIGDLVMAAPDPAGLSDSERERAIAGFGQRARAALDAAGYGQAADPGAIRKPLVVAILVALLFITALVTGPYSALLAELFPARIRYTALSFPQNFGNGWFGGLLPAAAFTIVAATGDVFAGLWYPVGFAALGLAVGALALPETRGRAVDG